MIVPKPGRSIAGWAILPAEAVAAIEFKPPQRRAFGTHAFDQ
jgi:hypothetical protein